VLAARNSVDPDSTVVVLSGDHPLIAADLVADLVAQHERAAVVATLLSTDKIDPAGYGRIIHAADGSVERIVETKTTDGVPAEVLATREINVGTYAFDAAELFDALGAVEEVGGERYLTGVFAVLRERGQRVGAYMTDDVLSALGVNTRVDLMTAELHLTRRLVEQHALAGVTFLSPETTTIEADVEIGEDTVIAQGVTLQAGTRIGVGCQIGPHTTLVDTRLGDGVWVAHSYLTEAEVEDGGRIGPFAYLRPGTVVRKGAKIGTFVEVKNSDIGEGTKVPHLSYIGDADIGSGVNLGASTITANYDGENKHRTTIGDGVHTGVHTSLVAPVELGDDADTGAGSVVTNDVAPGRHVRGIPARDTRPTREDGG
jgi:bifunctional UDP-N-acetylglucosamine pyrophosphorylase/glucosamine-1-phosphate N-acetyltransferase